MELEEIKSLTAQVWEYELNLPDEREAFLWKVSLPIEVAIADDDKTVIDHLLSISPVERFFLQVTIKHGCEDNPNAKKLLDKLTEDKRHITALEKVIEDNCREKKSCDKDDICTAIHENIIDGLRLTPKGIELYKRWCRYGFSEFEPNHTSDGRDQQTGE